MDMNKVVDTSDRHQWDSNHSEYNYSDVFSILDAALVQHHFLKTLSRVVGTAGTVRVLLPGCGSNTTLQRLCWQVLKDKYDVQIWGVDWSASALTQAKLATDRLGVPVIYEEQDFKCLGFDDNFFDAILLSNAIVSRNLSENESALKELARVLRPNGLLGGTFPSAFGMFDYALCSGIAGHWLNDGTVNVFERTVYEKSQDMLQRFFTPLELRKACIQTTLIPESVEILFFEGREFAEQMKRLYQLPFNDQFCLWGIFLNAIKRVQSK